MKPENGTQYSSQNEKHPVETMAEPRIRGIDLGLEKFATFDDATSTEYPEYLRQSEDKIKSLQRRFSHKKKGSKRWLHTCFTLARLHLHVKRQREDYQNKLVANLFKQNDAVVLEKLNIKGMLRNHHLTKSIYDASFNKFTRKTIFKAEALGKHFIPVDPWGTTQFCYNYLRWVPKGLSERNKCPKCGITIPRDVNSARLIKRLGILLHNNSCPSSDRGLSPAEPKPLPSLRRIGTASQGVEARSL